MSKQHESIRIFKNPILEKTTHVHPITPLVMWTPVVAWLIYRAFAVHELNPFSVGMIGVFALLVWTLTEYLLHRFVFHIKWDTPRGERLQFLIHGLHHDDPNDATRLVMPPVPAIFLALICWGTFRFALGPVWSEPFFAFFIVGYLCYDYTHFAIHHFTPRSSIGKMLKRNHMRHHFGRDGGANALWGVSSPLWDHIFGTLEEPRSVSHGS